ncbi:retrovirus-related pol polyprotein from transposon TNT 1-94 [Tanacetum coccineum]
MLSLNQQSTQIFFQSKESSHCSASSRKTRLSSAIIFKGKGTWLDSVLSQREEGMQHDPEVVDGQLAQIITHNATFQTDDLDAYDSDCDDIYSTKAVLMANLLSFDSNVLSKDKANNKSKIVNESLTAELERYKEQVKILEQRLNVDLSSRKKFIDSQMDDMIRMKNTKFAAYETEIDTLKQTLYKHVKEKESLLTTLNAMHMLIKPQVFYDNTHKQAHGYQNPFYLKRAQWIKPTLYDVNVLSKTHDVIPVIDEEESLILAEESQLKMVEKQNDPIMKKEKINITPINYSELNKLSKDFGKCFVPQQVLFVEKMFWLQSSNKNSEEPSTSNKPVKIEVPSELPKSETNMDEIETINIELEHSVAKLLFENKLLHKEIKHLKNIYKDQFDSIKKTCACAKEESDSLIAQLNSKSMENTDLEGQIQEKAFVTTALQNELIRLKGKNMLDNATTIALGMFKLDIEPISHRLKNNMDAHEDYLKKTIENTNTIHGLIERARKQNRSEPILDTACMFMKHVHELLVYVSKTCPSLIKPSDKLVVVTPMNKDKKVRSNLLYWSVKSMANKKNHVSKTECNAYVMHSMLNANFKSVCAICNECLFDANLDKCALNYVYDVNVLSKSKRAKRNNKKQIWKPTGSPPLVVPLKETNIKLVLTPTQGIKVVQIVLWYSDSGCSKHMTRNRSQLTNFVNKFLGTVKFGNDQIAKIMGYGDYQIGNVTISRVYYVEGLGYNLFSVGQLCDSNLEVAFRKHTCFVRNLEGVDLLTGSRGTNLYTFSIGDMMKSSSICLLTKASKTNYYEDVGISHETSMARTPQLNDIVERQNRTLVEAARTMLIYAKAPLFYGQKKPDLSYLHVFGALCYLTNDSEDLGKLKAKADVGPALHEMTPGTSVQDSCHNLLLQHLLSHQQVMTRIYCFNRFFDEYFHPSPCVDHPVLEVAALEPTVSSGTPSSTSVDQDAPSPSTSQTPQESPSYVIPPDGKEADHDINAVIPNNVHSVNQPPEHINEWTKDHPYDNVIGDPSRPVSTRHQLQTKAMLCYFDAFLSSVKPNSYKEELTESYWIEAMQEELNEFERLEVWELVPCPDRVMIIIL